MNDKCTRCEHYHLLRCPYWSYSSTPGTNCQLFRQADMPHEHMALALGDPYAGKRPPVPEHRCENCAHYHGMYCRWGPEEYRKHPSHWCGQWTEIEREVRILGTADGIELPAEGWHFAGTCNAPPLEGKGEDE